MLHPKEQKSLRVKNLILVDFVSLNLMVFLACHATAQLLRVLRVKKLIIGFGMSILITHELQSIG